MGTGGMSSGNCHHGNPANGTCLLCKDEYIDMTLYGKPPSCPTCAAALAAKEKAEGALCLLRSEVDKAINVLKVRMKSDGTPRDFIVEDLERVHYSDAPCPHEAEAGRLREAVDEAPRWSMREVDSDDDPLYDGMETDEEGAWINLAELRRRTAG